MRKVAAHAVRGRAAKMITVAGSVTAILGALALPALALPASAGTARPSYDVRQILSGQSLHHWYTKSGHRGWYWERLTQPDDITTAGGYLFTGFQNGVGPQGQASTDGNRDSTIVEFSRGGQVIRQWDVRGKCDGLTANPATGRSSPRSTRTRTPACTASTPGAGRSGTTTTTSHCRTMAERTPSPSTAARC